MGLEHKRRNNHTSTSKFILRFFFIVDRQSLVSHKTTPKHNTQVVLLHRYSIILYVCGMRTNATVRRFTSRTSCEYANVLCFE